MAGCVLAACSGGGGDEAGRSTTTSTPPTSTTEPPTFDGDAGSPFCQLLRDVDPSTLLAGDPGDPASVEAGFRRLVRALRDLRPLAPSDIEADVALVAEGVEALDGALAAVGYDFDALAASGASAQVTAAVNHPAFATAGDRLSAYRTQVCRL